MQAGPASPVRSWDEKRMSQSQYQKTLQQALLHRSLRAKPDYTQIAVLLVDDEASALDLCTKLLQRIGFSDIDTAVDGLEAWTKMQERKYGVVISDWNMPEMTGFDLVRKIRVDEKLARTAFLMTSVDGGVDRARIARQAGVNAFLIKPFDAGMLRGKLHEVLGPLAMRTAA
jgi:two-component system, chemotaxis family, chemotaxis protein CheY